MKLYLITFIAALCCYSASAQEAAETRNITIKYIQEDSVYIALNENFDMIEDSCSQVLRYTHFNADDKKFYGPFTDISKFDPKVIITQGYYDKAGFKQGLFTAHYIDGNVQAKGNFKNNVFDGKWETFYDNGKPKVSFVGTGNVIRILNAWAINGTKEVDNGNGNYIARLASDHTGGQAAWSGKLLNGLPDGVWTFEVTTNGRVAIINKETFKDGHFVKGIGVTGNYKNASRIVMIPPESLPFLQAENMAISSYPCNENTTMFTEKLRKNDDNIYIDAHYEDRNRSFWNELSGGLSDQFRDNHDFRALLGWFDIHVTAEVDEHGKFINIKVNGGEPEVGRGVVSALRNIRILSPATINGKPVKQNFTFNYIYNKTNGIAKMDYKFLPINIQ